MMNRFLMQYDVSRGRIPKVETIRKHVPILKHYGLTGIVFYIEGVIENSVFPYAGCGETPITKAYLEELNAFLTAEGLEFMPILQVMSHHENLLKDPTMADHREFEHEESHIIRIDSDKTNALLEAYVAEVSSYFNSPYIHIGTDEGHELGLGRSKTYFKNCGSYEAGLAIFYNRWNQVVKQLGKKMVIYGDFMIHYPMLNQLLDNDITVCNWNYGTLTETYELENHNFAMHPVITANRPNWVSGNCMAEYVITPFQRLKTNTEIWQKLGTESGAECFVISNWGMEGTFSLTLAGTIYILQQRQSNASLNLSDWCRNLAQLICGQEHPDYAKALERLLGAHQNPQFFPAKLSFLGPLFSTLQFSDPDSRAMIRLTANIAEDQAALFVYESRRTMTCFAEFEHINFAYPELAEELKMLSRRLLLIALRLRLIIDYTWHTGAIWVQPEDVFEQKERLDEYKNLAHADIEWTMTNWERDNLTGCRENYRRQMLDAIATTEKTYQLPENSMLYFPPQPLSNHPIEPTPE